MCDKSSLHHYHDNKLILMGKQIGTTRNTYRLWEDIHCIGTGRHFGTTGKNNWHKKRGKTYWHGKTFWHDREDIFTRKVRKDILAREDILTRNTNIFITPRKLARFPKLKFAFHPQEYVYTLIKSIQRLLCKCFICYQIQENITSTLISHTLEFEIVHA